MTQPIGSRDGTSGREWLISCASVKPFHDRYHDRLTNLPPPRPLTPRPRRKGASRYTPQTWALVAAKGNYRLLPSPTALADCPPWPSARWGSPLPWGSRPFVQLNPPPPPGFNASTLTRRTDAIIVGSALFGLLQPRQMRAIFRALEAAL